MSTPNPETEHTEQNLFNLSFDPEFSVLAAELLGFTGTALTAVQVDADGKLQITV